VRNETTTTVAGHLITAEDVTRSGVRKGSRDVVTAPLRRGAYDTDDMRKRSTIELVADDVGGSSRHAFVQAVPPGPRTAGRPAAAPPGRSAGAVP